MARLHAVISATCVLGRPAFRTRRWRGRRRGASNDAPRKLRQIFWNSRNASGYASRKGGNIGVEHRLVVAVDAIPIAGRKRSSDQFDAGGIIAGSKSAHRRPVQGRLDPAANAFGGFRDRDMQRLAGFRMPLFQDFKHEADINARDRQRADDGENVGSHRRHKLLRRAGIRHWPSTWSLKAVRRHLEGHGFRGRQCRRRLRRLPIFDRVDPVGE